ncbi:hypothetical protein SKUN_001437 [Spiroplasma kunkelii CR2-3x]|uniref:Uncharacterized protein n=1 Tax=Spiroplasma kunkelii CR2-3x TaxID=273035 RepID=A0A0K2JJA8_SPIKU|nr:hypothetical protein [Spiroplasma kunkelii]ALA98301.1 hypothetical protein SKUN_001437 [Spiroplasma kunkelii CR2-3x]
MNIKLFKKVYKSYIYEFLNENAIDNWIHGDLILSSCNERFLINYPDHKTELSILNSSVIFSKLLKKLNDEDNFINGYKFASSQKGYILTKNKIILNIMAKSLRGRAFKLLERANKKSGMDIMDLMNERIFKNE